MMTKIARVAWVPARRVLPVVNNAKDKLSAVACPHANGMQFPAAAVKSRPGTGELGPLPHPRMLRIARRPTVGDGSSIPPRNRYPKTESAINFSGW